jgi:RpiB/LacA/LacB family sugar-phosphate isomerase
MKIYIGSDHGGYNLKEDIKKKLSDEDFKIVDMGAKVLKQDDDYPIFAERVADEVVKKKDNLGVLICRSGIGMSIAANKERGIRAALCTKMGQVIKSRAHNNCNILVLGADFTEADEAASYIKNFIAVEFSKEERHQRRIDQIKKIREE